jgi:hypothetical protein
MDDPFVLARLNPLLNLNRLQSSRRLSNESSLSNPLRQSVHSGLSSASATGFGAGDPCIIQGTNSNILMISEVMIINLNMLYGYRLNILIYLQN